MTWSDRTKTGGQSAIVSGLSTSVYTEHIRRRCLGRLITGEGRTHHGEILAHITALVETGKLMPLLNDHVISAADIDSAHTLVESGAVGKVVVELGG